MKRALVEGRDHFKLVVGAAVLANNLMVIAELLRRQAARRRRPAAYNIGILPSRHNPSRMTCLQMMPGFDGHDVTAVTFAGCAASD